MTDADSTRAQRLTRIAELGAVLETYKAAEPGPRFMGDIPERWMDGDMRWRCPNGHVRGGYIKSEEFGGDCCQPCYSNPASRGTYVRLSFPEDTEGQLAPRPVPETAALTVPIRTTFCWGCHAEGVQPLFESPASHVRIVGDGSAVICGPCGDGYTLSPPAYLDEPPAPPAEPVEAHEHDWEVMPARVCWACPCGARADIISDEPPTEEDLEWARQIIAERHAEPVEEAQRYYVRFDGPPSHDSGRFIELETESGRSVGPETSGAHWYLQDDGTWLLGPFGRAPSPPPVEVEDEGALIVNAAAAYREAFDRHLATPSVATRLARDDAKEVLLRVAHGDQP